MKTTQPKTRPIKPPRQAQRATGQRPRKAMAWPGITIWSVEHQKAFGAFMRANYEHNVAMGGPTAEQNRARYDAARRTSGRL